MRESKKNIILLFLIMLVLIIISYIQIYKIYGGKNPGYDYIDAYNGACNSDSGPLADYCDIDISGLPNNPDTYTIFFSIIRYFISSSHVWYFTNNCIFIEFRK